MGIFPTESRASSPMATASPNQASGNQNENENPFSGFTRCAKETIFATIGHAPLNHDIGCYGWQIPL